MLSAFSLGDVPLAELEMLAAGLVLTGALTGILAGVFGVGGGAIIVPVIYEMFRMMHVPDDVRMALCVGTSLAVIIPTSVRSFSSHKARGTVDMTILRRWLVPILIGVLLGSWIARYANPNLFKAIFVFVASLSAVRLLGGLQLSFGDELPDHFLMHIYGVIIGLLSALMGIGGGQLSSMVMSFYKKPIHQIVSTSSGVGILISVPGTIGYMLAGYGKMGLPPFSIGFVSLLGLILFAPISILTAPLGVRIAHALSKRALEIAFGCFLVLVASRFAFSLVLGN
jgi:uncharacterized membrane protein YfcA